MNGDIMIRLDGYAIVNTIDSGDVIVIDFYPYGENAILMLAENARKIAQFRKKKGERVVRATLEINDPMEQVL